VAIQSQPKKQLRMLVAGVAVILPHQNKTLGVRMVVGDDYHGTKHLQTTFVFSEHLVESEEFSRQLVGCLTTFYENKQECLHINACRGNLFGPYLACRACHLFITKLTD
jgi:hypothetical protein